VDVCRITEAGLEPVSPDAVEEIRHSQDGILWLDFRHTDEAGMALLPKLVPVRPADLAECYSRSPVPKLRAYADHHFSAINGLARGDNGRLYFQPLKTFLTPNLLVTVLGPTSQALSEAASHRDLTAVRRQLEAGELRPAVAFDLIAAIRFQMLRAHEELVTAAAARIGELERRVMRHDPVRAEALLQDLFGLRHDLQTIRTNTAQTQQLYDHVIEMLESQDGLMPLNLRRFRELEHGFGHLRNTTDLEREYLQEVLDLFQTRVSTELNRFVRKITAFGTIGIGWTVIAGIYGMNFAYMPELDWRFGYPFTLGLMALVGIVFAIFFRKRGWL